MKTYKLICEEINEEYPIKNIGKFDPFVEYFMFDKISNDDFKELPKKHEVYRLPHYTGGCCDYTNKHKKFEQEERIKMFEKISCFMEQSER